MEGVLAEGLISYGGHRHGKPLCFLIMQKNGCWQRAKDGKNLASRQENYHNK